MANDKKQNQAAGSTDIVKATPQEDVALAAMQNWDEKALLDAGASREVIFTFAEPGEKLRGIYVGEGGPIKMTQVDPKTGNPTELRSWKIKNGNITVRLIGRHEIDGWLSGMAVGAEVAIIFKGKQDLPNGHTVNRFAMYVVKEAPSTQAALNGGVPAQQARA